MFDTYLIAQLLCLFAMLAGATACDIAERRIPNWIVGSGIVVALGIHIAATGLGYGLWNGLAGLAIGFAALLLFYILGGMSAGDVKLMAAVGAFLGIDGAMIASVATLAAGGVLGIGYVTWQILASRWQLSATLFAAGGPGLKPPALPKPDVRQLIKSNIPYAPAIAVGAYFAVWRLDLLSAAIF